MGSELKLLPCPGCREPVSRSHLIRDDDGMYAVTCPNCRMRGPGARGPTWATENWNALPRRPRWTNEPPTNTGEVWFYRTPSSEPIITYTFRPAPDLPLMAAYLDGCRRPLCATGYEAVTDMPGQWAGPISMPEDAR